MEAKCLAILKQGPSKGDQCWRPPSENGYCGIHQVDAIIEKGILEGLHKCSTHRCVAMIKDGTYCSTCLDKKSKKKEEGSKCRALYTQGPKKGAPCDKHASTPEGFCGKHAPRNMLTETAAGAGRRVCDYGKRACKNFTEDGKLKCEECLEKDRIADRKRNDERRERGCCLGCGCELTEIVIGYRKSVQRCEKCYKKLKQTEEKRVRENRNYKQERKENIESHYLNYTRGALKRNIKFEISIEKFETISSMPCRYCGKFVESEINGIDRIDSTEGYCDGNIIPACSKCNIMKNDLTVKEFIDHIISVYKHYSKHGFDDIVDTRKQLTETSYIRPKHILSMYSSGNLDKFIELCIADKRSPVFIDKMRELKTMKVTEVEARLFIKIALGAEIATRTRRDRQRVNIKEMFGYLNLKNIDECVDRYTYVYGHTVGFREDIEELIANWSNDNSKNMEQFNKIIIKYRNKRNISK